MASEPALFDLAPLLPLANSAALRAAPENGQGAAAPAPGATVADPAGAGRLRGCCECGRPFRVRYGARQLFCAKACKTAFENRMTVRGRQLTVLAMAARQTRDGTRRRLMQQWRDEDAAAGRISAADFMALRLALGHGPG